MSLAADFFYSRVEHQLDILRRAHLVLKYLCAAEAVAPVNQIDLPTESREIERIAERHIAAADHGRDLVPVEIAVTGRTVGDAAAGQLLLSRHTEEGVLRAARNHDGFRRIVRLRADHGSGTVLVDADLFYLVGHKCGSELLRMLPELLSELKTADARQSRIVVHFQGIDNLTAADHLLFNHNQIQLCSLSVNRRRQSRGAGPNDNHIVNLTHTASLSYTKRACELHAHSLAQH